MLEVNNKLLSIHFSLSSINVKAPISSDTCERRFFFI